MTKPTFGARVSPRHPTFEVGETEFETRLLTMSEEREMSRLQQQLPSDANADHWTPEQTDQTVNVMADVLALILAPRVKDKAHSITREWVLNNTTAQDFDPLLYLLRTGEQLQDA